MKKFIIALFMCLPLVSQAEIIQILHTNDLHSYQEHYNHDPLWGGYARVKKAVDKYRNMAKSQGIETLLLDGGDFLEGHMYYLAENGERSFSLLNQMGYDAVVLGNHDYLMGTQGLDELLKNVPPDFKLLLANTKIPDGHPNIEQHLTPYHTFEIGGKRITIVGLTTSEIFYTWKFKPGKITNALRTYRKIERELKAQNSDAVIALTHLGHKTDQKLVSRSKYLDLVVGGHSHTYLEKVDYHKNLKGRKVPIVQAGEHGKKLGRLIVDVSDSGLKVLQYDLINLEDTAIDEDIDDYVFGSRLVLEEDFGSEWLYEVVGHSELKENDRNSQRQWTFFVSDAIREAVDADVSIHITPMVGNNYPIGSINRFDLYNSHPRTFEFTKPLGWNVYKVKISGFLIKAALRVVTMFELPMAISGLTFEKKGKKIRNIRINNKRVSSFKNYSLALPEGIITGAKAITSLYKYVFIGAKKYPIRVMEAIEDKIINENGVIGYDYLEKNSIKALDQGEEPISRQFYPGIER